MRRRRSRRNRKIKYLILLVSLGVILCSTVTFAYLQWRSNVNNTFSSAESEEPVINEQFDGKTKKNVTITVGDTGYSSYVRAIVVINWVKNDGTISAQAPMDDEYSIDYQLSDSGWFQGNDGFYYYAQPVNSGQTTGILINECKPLVEAPDGYYFNVEIVAQTIQSAGTTDEGDVPAVTNAWGIAVENGKLKK